MTLGLTGVLLLPVHVAKADDSDASATSDSGADNTSATTKKKKKKAETVDAENNRMQSQVGSKSRFSLNLVLTYNGPSVSSPFSANAPNPTGTVPPPLVNMQGFLAARYRIDPATTLSLGTGLMVYTPFNGAKNWSLADPYLNYNHLFKFSVFRSYLQAGVTVWTDNQYYTLDGYRLGPNFTDETYYVYKRLTAGLLLWGEFNFFASGDYDPTQQNQWWIGGGPYLEFTLTPWLNLRSVLAVQGDHLESMPAGAVSWENAYQTLGLGVQVVKAWYIYFFVGGAPYSGNFTAQNSWVGFNTIINLF